MKNYFLKRKLQEWLDNEIISFEIYNKIIEYENQIKKSYFWKWLIIIASISQGLGILSIITANWEYIPTFFKFLGIFVLHLIIIIIYLWYENNSKNLILSEGLLVLLSLFLLGEIGLISQTFHLEGKLYYLFLSWSILSFFITILTNTIFLPFIIFSVIFLSLFFVILDYLELLKYNYNFIVLIISFIVPFLVFYIVYKLFNRNNFLRIMNIMFFLFFIFHLIYNHFLWYQFDFIHLFLDIYAKNNLNNVNIGLEIILYLFFIVIIIYFYKEINLEFKNLFKKNIFYILLIFFFLDYILIRWLSQNIFIEKNISEWQTLLKFLGTLFFLLILILASYISQELDNRIFKIMNILIILRLYIIYMEVFESLVLTGWGFILFGMFIFLTYYLYKFLNKFLINKNINKNYEKNL